MASNVCTGKIAQNVDKPNGFLTAVIDGQPYTITAANNNFKKALDAFKQNDWSNFIAALSPAQLIATWGVGKITVSNGQIFYKSAQINGSIVEKILSMIDEDINIEYLLRFLNKLYKNPSVESINEAWDFLNASGFVIDKNGDILAYRSVRNDFKDHHSGKFDNSPGQVCQMKRSEVDADRNRTCSRGLHAGAWRYSSTFGHSSSSKLVLIKINPKHIVSVPTDYSGGKMRVCQFTVLSEYTSKEPLKQSDVLNSTLVEEDEDDDDDVLIPDVTASVRPTQKAVAVQYDSLGRPIPPRDASGRFIKS